MGAGNRVIESAWPLEGSVSGFQPQSSHHWLCDHRQVITSLICNFFPWKLIISLRVVGKNDNTSKG